MALAKRQRVTAIRPDRLAELAEFRFCLRQFLNFSEMAAERVGISAQQYQLLQVVAAVPEDQECSISYLADRMLLRHNSAVELVDRAEKTDLVRRMPDETDHRRSLVELTERGSRLLAALVEAHLSEIETAGPQLAGSLQKLIGAQARKRNGTR